MGYNFFSLLARMKFIRRWGLMRNTMAENISEHSQMVAMLAFSLAVIERDIFDRDIDPHRLSSLGIFHDVPEILTGDLPTPIKYINPELQTAYRDIEESSARKLLSFLPNALQPSFQPLLFPETEFSELELSICKAADKLSAYIKCQEELNAGNREFRKAKKQTLQALQAYRLPSVDYFIKNFLPGFELSLDEM